MKCLLGWVSGLAWLHPSFGESMYGGDDYFKTAKHPSVHYLGFLRNFCMDPGQILMGSFLYAISRSRPFVALVFATAQQSYCHHVGIRRWFVKNPFSQKPSELMPNIGISYLTVHISRPLLCLSRFLLKIGNAPNHPRMTLSILLSKVPHIH